MGNKEYSFNFSVYLRKSRSDLTVIQEYFRIEDVVLAKEKDEVYFLLEKLDYTKYYEVIRLMKKTNSPVIPYDKYDIYINISQNWDGYIQVFFWKILTYQKILFKYDIDIEMPKSLEAIEGYEIFKNIK
jgi:hypothetical protein